MRTPTSPTDRWRFLRTDRGFTLIEMLAVLVIIAVAAVVVSANVGRPVDSLSLQALAGKTASQARQVRDRAIRSGRDGVLLIDLEGRRVAGLPPLSSLTIAPQIDVDVVAASQERRSPATAAIRFFANGASTGGTIRYAYQGTTYEVRVNWFNGRVTVVRTQ